jgi:hypothetical protein
MLSDRDCALRLGIVGFCTVRRRIEEVCAMSKLTPAGWFWAIYLMAMAALLWLLLGYGI